MKQLTAKTKYNWRTWFFCLTHFFLFRKKKWFFFTSKCSKDWNQSFGLGTGWSKLDLVLTIFGRKKKQICLLTNYFSFSKKKCIQRSMKEKWLFFLSFYLVEVYFITSSCRRSKGWYADNAVVHSKIPREYCVRISQHLLEIRKSCCSCVVKFTLVRACNNYTERIHISNDNSQRVNKFLSLLENK